MALTDKEKQDLTKLFQRLVREMGLRDDVLSSADFGDLLVGDGDVTADKLGDSAVTADKIADGAVTADKLGEDVVLPGLGAAKMFRILAEDTSTDYYYAAIPAETDTPYTEEHNTVDYGRNVVVTATADYDGGDVTVNGTRLGEEVSETITPIPEASVDGSQIFDEVVSVVMETPGTTGDIALGIGDTIGLPITFEEGGILFVDNVAESFSWDGDEGSVTPTTSPDGMAVFVVFVN